MTLPSPTMNDRLVAAIRAQLKKTGKSARAASLEATGSPETLRKILDGSTRHPRVDTLTKLAHAIGLSPEVMLEAAGGGTVIRRGDVRPAGVSPPIPTALPSDVPVMGTAAGSLAGAFQLTDSPVDYVRRPPGLTTARDIYAIYIEGESMIPEHRPGDLRFVSPHKPPAIGDTVVIQVRPHEHAPIEAYIKHLVRRLNDKVVARQLNPEASIEFRRQSIVALHKVLSVNELFGV